MKKIIQIAVIGATLLVANSAVQAADAEGIYNTKCMACHATGAANAPKLGDKEAWAPRIATGKDALLASAINGKNAMPPKGACMECSDEDLAAVIDYMTSKSQ
ncbi:MAG TPA: c-type cytochrome [Gammaproteobacteria bacterium]|nr:c-type cytochrome [Gammaproteobacteria bacterium]